MKTISTKYITVYPYNTETDNTEITDISGNTTNLNIASTNNWKVNTLIYGDAIRETSTEGTGSTSWYNDYSYFWGLGYPFSIRSGNFNSKSNAGLFFFYRTNGGSAFHIGFRAVIVI